MRSVQRAAKFMLLFLALLLPIAAWGMAGGGGGYSSGGGGGSSSDSGAIIDLILFILQICLEYPRLGIPLVIAIIILFAVSCLFSKDKGASAYKGHVIRKANSYLIGAQKEQAVAALTANDPDFSEPQFLSRVHAAFTRIQQAWCAQQMTQAQAFVSDGIIERFTLQIQEQRDLGYRDRMDDLAVDPPELAQASSDENFDIVAVRVASRARDYRVDLKTEKPLASVPPLREYSEYWSFMRRRGARTIPGKPGLMEGNCPNCGVSIAMNQSANCPQCSALLRSGQYDWVLAEITQECEWRGCIPIHPPGIDAIRAGDPEFNLQQIEDRVSVMFWRCMEAGRRGKIDPLRKIATPECCEKITPQLSIMDANGRRTWWGECAVGSVDTLGLKHDAGKHSALVEVRWAGTRFYAAPGQPAVRGSETTLAASLYMITRKATAKSEAAKSLTSAHCPSCGAPERLTTANACEYCGVIQNDGAHGWVLEAIEPATSSEGRALVRDFRPINDALPKAPAALPGLPLKGGTAGQLAWVVHMCAADGEITTRERAWIDKVAARWNLPPHAVERMISAALKGALTIPEPEGRDEVQVWLRDMTRSALADGSLSHAEEKLLIATGEKYNYSKADIRLLIALVKKELYEAAKAQLRDRRAS